MRTLLIAHYWYPYNSAGTFRWLNFSKYMDFDVLTTRVPTNSSYDETIEDTGKKTFRYFKNLPAVLWGVLASFIAVFKKYDRYIITSPPESLLLCALVLQLLGRTVIVDMRDAMDRERQKFKFLLPVYLFLYKKIKNVVVCWKAIDPTKPLVYHGYEEADKHEFVGYYKDRVSHGEYIKRLGQGLVPDQSHKPKGYFASSYHTLKHLGYPINVELHEEIYGIEPKSIKERVAEYEAYLKTIK